MPSHPEAYLKTQQVAQALGLSSSTVKRLVDAGHIRAARTEGKHRLIAQGELQRYARERGMTLTWAKNAVISDGAASRRPAIVRIDAEANSPEQVEALCNALRRGRYPEARALVVSAFEMHGPVYLADALIRPAMAQLGHDWQVQGIDIFQEHRATRLVKMVLFELLQREMDVQGSELPLAIGAACEGDPYLIPGLLCELSLRCMGWDVMNLGVNLPLESLGKAVIAHRPRLVWLSVSHLTDPDRFVNEYTPFFEAATACGTAVILGGQALSRDLRTKLVAASFGDRMAHLAEFARLLSRPDAAALDRSPRDRDQ